jgi:hypothetical protein
MTPAAQEKITEALKCIEDAQNRLDEACQHLCPIVGLVKEWERLGKLAERVNAEWHLVNALSGPFRLDTEPR